MGALNLMEEKKKGNKIGEQFVMTTNTMADA